MATYRIKDNDIVHPFEAIDDVQASKIALQKLGLTFGIDQQIALKGAIAVAKIFDIELEKLNKKNYTP